MNYSQNNEQEVILHHFRNRPMGALIDIGANDGITFSNSRALLMLGWYGWLIEPNKEAFKALETNSKGLNCKCLELAIANTNGTGSLFVNSPHIEGDKGLLATLVAAEQDRWKGSVDFNPELVEMRTFESIIKDWPMPSQKIDFITIDAEGLDLDILRQIDLDYHQVDMVCVEHNGKDKDKFISYCQRFQIVLDNAENLIFAR